MYIQPESIRIGEEQAKGYLKEDFLEVFRRYVPVSEFEELRDGFARRGPRQGEESKERKAG